MLCIDLVLWIVELLLLELVPLFISLGVSPVGEGVVGVAKLDNDCVGSFFKVLFEDVRVLVPIGLGVSLFDSLVNSPVFEVAAVKLDTSNEVVLFSIGTGVSKTGGFVVISREDCEVSCEIVRWHHLELVSVFPHSGLELTLIPDLLFELTLLLMQLYFSKILSLLSLVLVSLQ